MADINTDIRFVKGVGDKRAQILSRLGIYTLKDLLYHFPKMYEDRTKISYIFDTLLGEVACVEATVCSPVVEHRIRSGLSLFKFKAADESGVMNVTLFNQRFLAKSIKTGEKYIFYGSMQGNLVTREMTSPQIEKKDKEHVKIVPKYPLTADITNNALRKLIKSTLEITDLKQFDFIDKELLEKYGLCDIDFALNKIHFPNDFDELEKAKRRLVFDEFLVYSLGLLMLKNRRKSEVATPIKPVDMNSFYNALGFELTQAQKRVIKEALEDMAKTTPLNRLVQGDVGSGKTAVSMALIYAAAKNKVQSVMMVPTEILANQHYNSIQPMFSKLGIETALLTSSTKKSEKENIKDRLKAGEIDLLIGTHAVISDDVEFKNLCLCITDEQHRFGTEQRALLSKKGEGVHCLVMSATPIPRTLALIAYGDLDISVIDTMPPGRMKIDTLVVDSSYRDRYMNFIREQVVSGRQAYIVCPAIEGEEEDLKSVSSFYEEIKDKYFKGIEIEIMHGKMKAAQKESTMKKFVDGEIKILVSTTVIEVGVNVPNASVMLIENAERYGLSQLHQLRGRVGRGEYKSYCILSSDNKSKLTKQRLKVMHDSTDGFYISKEDLKLRGPGEFFGTAQHGEIKLKIASLIDDTKILSDAQSEAKEILKNDNELKNNEKLKNEVLALFKGSDKTAFN